MTKVKSVRFHAIPGTYENKKYLFVYIRLFGEKDPRIDMTLNQKRTVIIGSG